MKEIKNNSIDVEKLIKCIDSGKFSTDLPWQRMDGLLDNYQQSLMIDTTLRGFKIPAIWVTKTPTENFEKNSIIDGVQRTTTLYNYVKNKFRLHKDMKPIIVASENENGENVEKTFEIAGKKFKQLPEYLQSRILDYPISIIEMIGYNDEDIEEQFFRLNNGATFTKSQKIKVILGTQLAGKINHIENLPFWNRTAYTIKQRREGKITATIMQCLMVITGFDYKNLEAKEIERFAVYYPDNYNIKDLQYLEELFNKLDKCMLDSNENNRFLKKINIPPLIICTDKFLSMESDKFTEDNYTKFLNRWVRVLAKRTGYLDNCGQGSTSITKVRNRIEIIQNRLVEYIDNCQSIKKIAVEVD